MQPEELLKTLCSREEEGGLYNVEIDGISIYYLIRRGIRDKIMQLHGMGENIQNPPFSKTKKCCIAIISLWHLIKLLLIIRKCNNIFRCFERLEKVKGKYLDKFTDPIIEEIFTNKNYIILEQGRSGKHLKPRIHSNKVFYTDAISILSRLILFLRKKYFYKKYSIQLKEMVTAIENTFPEITWNQNSFYYSLIHNLIISKIYSFIFKMLHAKRLIAPARGSFMNLIPAAKKNGMTVFELQHGITYSYTLTYSGPLNSYFTPDYFLSFGKLNSAKWYGVKEDQVVEIGWAFENFISKMKQEHKNSENVLVISSPSISYTMVNVTCKLAKEYPNVTFSFRTHPNEQLDEQRLTMLKSFRNITLNDNKESVSAVLTQFNNVIGENSTVLYEALAMGKNVGKICMEGLQPKYLNEEDCNYFYQISDIATFDSFLHGTIKEKTSKSIYSQFNPIVLEELLNNS